MSARLIAQLRVSLKKYKACSATGITLTDLRPINVLIGRNNAGKSSVLDAIACLHGQAEHMVPASPTVGCLEISFRTDNSFVDCLLEYPHDGGFENRVEAIRTQCHDKIGVLVREKPTEGFVPPRDRKIEIRGDHFVMVNDCLGLCLKQHRIVRLEPDRNIELETQPSINQELKLGLRGANSIKLVWRYCFASGFPHEIVESELLAALNEVFEGEIHFDRLQLFQLPSDQWEIHLTTSNGEIPLSNTGSGVRSVLIILIAMLIVPHSLSTSRNMMIYLIEEPEVNLHPGLLRRLLFWMCSLRRKDDSIIFLTTHSPTAIDFFAGREDSNLVHVRRDESGHTTIEPIKGYKDAVGILNDLEVRASDLLQANGVVWVEGPTDRLYFKKWVELFSDGELLEDIHFVCLPYGGSLLSYLSGAEPDDEVANADLDKFVKLLLVNRNALLIMDSDRESPNADLGSTKERLIAEFNDTHQMSWVTNGREIENYVPPSVLREVTLLSRIDDYQFADIEQKLRKKGWRTPSSKRQKIDLAHAICPKLTRENLSGHLDLEERMREVISLICAWNGMPTPAE